MRELWKLVDQIAKENTELVMNASLRELAELVKERAGTSAPSISHIRYILGKLGYTKTQGKHKGFVYRHSEGRAIDE